MAKVADEYFLNVSRVCYLYIEMRSGSGSNYRSVLDCRLRIRLLMPWLLKLHAGRWYSLSSSKLTSCLNIPHTKIQKSVN